MKQSDKNIILVILFVLTCVMGYKFAISNTLSLKSKVELLNKSFENSGEKQLKIHQLKSEIYYLDSIINNNNLKFYSVQNQLLTVLNKNSDSLNFKIISFKEPHEYVNEYQEKITSFGFKLEGNYKALEKILYLIENENNLGKVIHTNFKVEKEYRTKRKKLQVEAIISYIDKKKSIDE